MLYQTTQEQEAFRQKMRGFAESEVKPIAFMLDQNNEFPADAVKKPVSYTHLTLPTTKLV